MRDQTDPQDASPKYPTLSQLSTEELRRLLVHEMDAPNGETPDTGLIAAIEKVIDQREGTPKIDIDIATREFYGRLEAELEDPDMETSTAHGGSPKTHPARARPKMLQLFQKIAVVLVVFLAICGTASAFGLNIFEVVAEWTADTFHFVTQAPHEEASAQEDPFQDLRAAVSDITDTSVIPNWWPEGTAERQNTAFAQTAMGMRIYNMYTTDSGQFSIRIYVYDSAPDNFSAQYEKSDNDVLEYDARGITHYIFPNNGKWGAVWIDGLVEVAIHGDLTVEQLEKMIDSIY